MGGECSSAWLTSNQWDNRMTKPLAMWKQLLLVLALAGVGAALWYWREPIVALTGLGPSPDARQERRRDADRRVPVIVAPVKVVQAVDRLQAIGNGLSSRSITVYPETAGLVSEIDFNAGKRVKAGDVIMKLDETQAKIAVNIARTKLTDAERTLERYLSLLPKNAVAQATVDTTQTAVDTARLELEQAQEALGDRTVHAPFDGVLGIPQVEIGDRVLETTPIVTLDDRSAIIVSFDIPEIYLRQLKTGHPVTATTAAIRGRDFKGEISEIGTRIDTATRSVRIRATLRNPDDVLREGMSFVVSLTLEGANYPAIPEIALLWEREGAYVWRISANRAENVGVSVIKRSQGEILVEASLQSGDLVVVEGTQRLREGREVRFETPAVAATDRKQL
jgi:membrane fusion protein (multidrug efflux system)